MGKTVLTERQEAKLIKRLEEVGYEKLSGRERRLVDEITQRRQKEFRESVKQRARQELEFLKGLDVKEK